MFDLRSSLICALPSYKDLRARINRRITTLREASLLQGAHNLERGYEVNGSHRTHGKGTPAISYFIDACSCIAKDCIVMCILQY